jgi:glutamine cyclotransferase
MGRYVLLLASLLWLNGCANSRAQQATPEYGIRVARVYPHDRGAFTQGLEYHDGVLYESTGLEGRSGIRRVELETGRVLDWKPLSEPMFGEGITVFQGEIFQLTWQHQTGFVYRQSDFALVRRFRYPGEGWGLTNDGRYLYMSDGSDEIRVWDPATLSEVRRIQVHDGERRVRLLNELEWVDGEIFANIWQTNRIVRISPVDGKVTGWVDLDGLLSAEDQAEPVDVLNGIAYDAPNGRLFVTGKLWPKLFEIGLVKR